MLLTLSLFAQVVLWSGQGADLTTTLVAVQSGHFTEANPVLSNQPVRLVAVKVGTRAVAVSAEQSAAEYGRHAVADAPDEEPRRRGRCEESAIPRGIFTGGISAG
jgi:hypothetical protein